MSTKKLAIGDKIAVKRDGEVHQATIKRIGHGESLWVMLTLDIHGSVGYCVARREELAEV